MNELANVLQTYGGWGVSAILFYVCQRLYKDLRETEKTRLSESIQYADKLHATLKEAVSIVKMLERNGESHAS